MCTVRGLQVMVISKCEEHLVGSDDRLGHDRSSLVAGWSHHCVWSKRFFVVTANIMTASRYLL